MGFSPVFGTSFGVLWARAAAGVSAQSSESAARHTILTDGRVAGVCSWRTAPYHGGGPRFKVYACVFMATHSTFDISAPLTETFGAIVQPPTSGAALPDPGDVMRLLAERGAIILRGFPFTRASFTEFSNAACAGFSSYVGGGFRFRGLDRQSKDASGTVLSTTGSTQSFPIALHGEMYYQEQRPDVLWFFCEKAPPRRGQTTVADGAALFAGLSDASKDLLRSRRLLYVRQLGAADWPTTFQTEDPDAMKRICAANGTSVTMAPDGSIRTEYRAAAVRPGRGGRETFINNALMLWQFEAGFRAGLAVGAARRRRQAAAAGGAPRGRLGAARLARRRHRARRRGLHRRDRLAGRRHRHRRQPPHPARPPQDRRRGARDPGPSRRARRGDGRVVRFVPGAIRPISSSSTAASARRRCWFTPAASSSTSRCGRGSVTHSSPGRRATIGAVDGLTLLTCNNGRGTMGIFERSAERLGLPVLVRGQGIEPWLNSRDKPRVIRDALAGIDTEFVLYGDSRDAVLLRDPAEARDLLAGMSGCGLLFGGDRINWPPLHRFKAFELACRARRTPNSASSTAASGSAAPRIAVTSSRAPARCRRCPKRRSRSRGS